MHHKKFHIILLLTLLVCAAACNKKGALPSLKETYSYKDTKPFGTAVAYHIFKNAYPDKQTAFNKKEFGENYGWDYDSSSVYFSVSRNYYVTERDANALLAFVYRGNTAFISANHFDEVLLEKMFCKQSDDLSYLYRNPEMWRNTSLRFTKQLSIYKDSFGFFYFPFINGFTGLNRIYSRKMGYNEKGDVNFFVFMWGKGRIYLHSEPRALSNYFLLTADNSKYMQEIMQVLPDNPENIYWDNFYNKKNYGEDQNKNFSTLDTIMKYPPLAKAFFIAIALLLLYIFFNGKRLQRVVPVIKPAENNSVAFTEAIAGLYLQKKDNKIIADKMIIYFNEQIRTKYFLTIHAQEENYADALSRKSGVSEDITQPLAAIMKKISVSEKTDEQELLLLNDLIEKFIKNKV